MNSAYHRRVAFPSELGNSTSRQLHDLSPALIVPLGSTEQHGPHLPLDTDTRIADAVARAVAERLGSDFLLAPALGYGASGEHQGFPGTISIGTAALQLLLIEFGRSASSWASRTVFVNGHGGNVEAVARATTVLRAEGRDVAWCSCTAAGSDAHAGHTETSVLLHISPDVVSPYECVVGNDAPLAELMPAESEVHGLAALMEIQSSRARARVDANGVPVLLLEQDRSRWDRLLIGRGMAAVDRAAQLGGAYGPYALQAAIAACHARAATAEETDWGRIAALYDALAQLTPSPVIELNRAVALSMAFGPAAGLELVDRLVALPALKNCQLLPSVRGDFLAKLGRLDEARVEFERAAALTRNVRERTLLLARARDCANP